MSIIYGSSVFWGVILGVVPVGNADSGSATSPSALNMTQASAFAKLVLKGISKEYPNKPEHVLAGPDDLKSQKSLHPAFFGCYDWHSSVHGHWLLVRLLKLFPNL